MEYISHEDYKKMLTDFGKEVPKAKLNEGLEKEGNAFTAGLAKTKKGGEFKVGGKSFKDRTNYDASVSEELDSPYDGGADDLKAMARDAEGEAKILGHVKSDIYKVRTPKGEVIDLDFDLEKGDQVDDYGYEGTLVAYDDDYEYVLPVALVPMGGGDYDVTPYYEEFNTYPLKKKGVQEYQFDQMYPDDPGPFEGIEDKLKEFLAKEDDVNWDRMDDEEAEENETDNGIEEEEMEEDINLPSSQPTGPSIKEKKSRLAHLTSEERDQLKQYVETIKTVKEEIKKMVGKSDMEEGGDNTNLIMKPTTVSEVGGGDYEEVESTLDPKIHSAFHKVVGMAVKDLLKAGVEASQIKAFFQQEISELPEFASRQYEG